ncbi:hypothetical protein B4586_02190 [Lacticaseibacillus paracasei]|nr:hypothetical protein B4586_02190 [Lacticaseibacillus paracasei]
MWFLSASDHALAETRSQSQKPAHKNLKPKWTRPSHLGLRPLTLRFLNGLAHALDSRLSVISVTRFRSSVFN